MKSVLATAASLLLFFAVATAQTRLHLLRFSDVGAFQAFFHYTSGHVPIMSGHRGGTTAGYPENCIATFENTLKHTPAFFGIGNEMVMLTVHNAQQAKFYVDDDPDHMLSAWVLDKKAFDELEKAGVPWKNLIAYIGPTNKPENKELFDLLHAKGVMYMISAASSYDKLKDPDARALHYRETFVQGADILESDLLIEVAEGVKGL